jgi:hypothetical protein
VLAVLAEHGVTSSNIPAGFQSELYFHSNYYEENLRYQLWLSRRELFLPILSIHDWSVANQVESEYYRTLPSDLTALARFLARCCLHVDASGADNGIARLIITYFGGFDDSSSVRLLGMPAFGKNDASLPRCSYCDKEYSEAPGGLKLCCESVYYCRDAQCKQRGLRNHESVCVCDEAVERRKAEAAAEEARRKERRRAEDMAAAAAAASLLAELDLEDENDSKKKKAKSAAGGGQDSQKKKKKAKGGKSKKKK